MRLTEEQKARLLAEVHDAVGVACDVRLFGSRLDDSRRGGDLDLLLITRSPLPRLQVAELKQSLEEVLYLPVDIVTYTQGTEPTPFQAIALAQARSLDAKDAA
ncbi:nucleotidyltransferase domain-containing protein [Pistricoccus aurantiacus]|uniref:Nucleotidyltransferase domain-containing protein n=1 Tax=Pistricoccus aurantiacus TaxID=1883414 RepID=A0A5B8SLZ3_9GAMM|nr:nucleotidyltransferase domain-containing protein [Pistricoccus aurantiacus]QEA38142.1 nucleotidyltransferase domain-containing protein [Pistricoccus aurantiacus]